MSLLIVSGCEGGPDPYLQDLAVCGGCDDFVLQLRVGNAGDVPLADGVVVEAVSPGGEVRSHTIDEPLAPGELSAIYELGDVGDGRVRVVAPDDDCDPTNNVREVSIDDTVCR